MQKLFRISINGKVIGYINQFELKNKNFNCEVILIKIQKIKSSIKNNYNTIKAPQFEIPRKTISNVSKSEMDKQISEFVNTHFQGDTFLIEE